MTPQAQDSPDVILSDFPSFADERGNGNPPNTGGELPEALDFQLGEVITNDPSHEARRAVEQVHRVVHRQGRYKAVSLIDTAAGKTERTLDFLARSVLIYNLSESWFAIDTASGLWIAPGLYGAILPLVPGLSRGTLAVSTPPVVAQGSAKGEYCFAIFREDAEEYQPGILLGTLV